MANDTLDLSQLALDRPAGNRAGSQSASRPRKWISRYAIPSAILLSFAGLVLAAAGNSLWPRTDVRVLPVIVKRASVQQAGTPRFQAAGWIEPRPTPISVPALTPGIIDQLLVVEGQSVSRGEPIARLISIDAELAVEEARAAAANAEAELLQALANERAAKIRLEKPVHLQVQLADAQSFLAKIQTELSNLPFQIESAQVDLEFARKNAAAKRNAGGTVSGMIRQKAEAELAAADARLRELQKREPALRREMNALQDKVAALGTQLDLLIEENRSLQEATAKVKSAEARRDAARIRVRKAELELERNTIKAPIDGRILRLVASPGMRVMGLETTAGQSSSTVVEMYDPQRLQVRADVRLEDVPLVQVGQPVEIETAASESIIQGRVLQPTSSANIQKNTLQVKVELIEPPETVRPEMLVTATFLEPEQPESTLTTTQESERLFVPAQLLQTGESGNQVWIVDAQRQAQLRDVTVGKATVGDLLEVTSGLQITDKLIASDTSGLKQGMRVNISGEQSTSGR